MSCFYQYHQIMNNLKRHQLCFMIWYAFIFSTVVRFVHSAVLPLTSANVWTSQFYVYLFSFRFGAMIVRTAYRISCTWIRLLLSHSKSRINGLSLDLETNDRNGEWFIAKSIMKWVDLSLFLVERTCCFRSALYWMTCWAFAAAWITNATIDNWIEVFDIAWEAKRGENHMPSSRIQTESRGMGCILAF